MSTNYYKSLEISIKYIDLLVIELAKYANEKKSIADFTDVATFIILTEISELGKSLKILYDNNRATGIDSILRVLIERYFYLAHILKSESNAKAYILHFEIEKLNGFDLYYHNIDTSNLLAKELGFRREDILSKMKELNPQYLDDIYIRKITDDYLSCFNYTVKKDPKRMKWYDFNGSTNNLNDLCKSLNLQFEYSFNYKHFSREVHSSKISEIFRHSKEMSSFGILNPFIPNDDLLSFVDAYLFKSIRSVISKYKTFRILLSNFNEELRAIHDFSNDIMKRLANKRTI